MGQLYIDMVSRGCPPDDEVSARWLTERAWESSGQSCGAANLKPPDEVVVGVEQSGEERGRAAVREQVVVRREQAALSLSAGIVAHYEGETAAPGAIPSGEFGSIGARQHGHRVIVGGTNS